MMEPEEGLDRENVLYNPPPPSPPHLLCNSIGIRMASRNFSFVKKQYSTSKKIRLWSVKTRVSPDSGENDLKQNYVTKNQRKGIFWCYCRH